MEPVLPTVPEPTPRLAFRGWRESDAPVILDMYSRREVYRFLGSAPVPVHDLDEARSRVEARVARTHGLDGVWAIVRADDDAVIGTVLLVPLTRTDGRPSDVYEVGWHLHPDAWGRGFATEAARAVIARARAGGLREVRAVVYADNAASHAVCRRLGDDAAGTDERVVRRRARRVPTRSGEQDVGRRPGAGRLAGAPLTCVSRHSSTAQLRSPRPSRLSGPSARRGGGLDWPTTPGRWHGRTDAWWASWQWPSWHLTMQPTGGSTAGGSRLSPEDRARHGPWPPGPQTLGGIGDGRASVWACGWRTRARSMLSPHSGSYRQEPRLSPRHEGRRYVPMVRDL